MEQVSSTNDRQHYFCYTRPPELQENVSKQFMPMLLGYVRDTCGPATAERVIADAGVDQMFFENPHSYIPIEIADRLLITATKHSGDTDFAYHLGHNQLRYVSKVNAALVTLMPSPQLLLANMDKIESKMVRTTMVKPERIGKNRFRMSVSFAGDYHEPYSSCRMRQGAYESLPLYFGMPFAKVEHPQCFFRGDPLCVYEVTLPEERFAILRKVAAVLGAGGILASMVAVGNQNLAWLAGGTTVMAGALLTHSLFTHLHQRRALGWRRNTDQGTEEAVVELKKDTELTEKLHQLTIDLNRLAGSREISGHAARFFTSQYAYSVTQIWLLDDDGKMRCYGSSGMERRVEALVPSMNCETAEDMKRPESLLYKIFKNKETLLVSEFGKATANFFGPSQRLFSFIKPSSAIIVPLLDQGVPLGMLGAVNTGGQKVHYYDKVVFEAAAPVIATALVRARLLESMERKIALRGEQIEHQQAELLRAREMAIQSEKLSALGQMAAGVAHEINNPLNFLINIMPDLRHDLEALEEILNTGKNALCRDEDARRLDALMNEYQLAEHLAEKDSVFAMIHKSLSRAQRVVGSLKVFARTAKTGEVREEPVAELIAAALDLIPQRYRNDIAMNIRIDPAVRLKVNRIEMIQVFLALLQNAIEAMDGKGTVTVTHTVDSTTHGIVIADEGGGIDGSVADTLFDYFVTTKNPETHLGMGLSIAREIVAKYGGTVSIANNAGKGAAVTLVFGRP